VEGTEDSNFSHPMLKLDSSKVDSITQFHGDGVDSVQFNGDKVDSIQLDAIQFSGLLWKQVHALIRRMAIGK
jgi:hypothetical protein